MFFKTFTIAALAALFATQAAAIAADEVSACGCPNNCDYVEGDSCKYYAGGSDLTPVIEGNCAYNQFGSLACSS